MQFLGQRYSPDERVAFFIKPLPLGELFLFAHSLKAPLRNEFFVGKDNMKHFSVKRLVTLAILAALSILLAFLVRFPLFPALPFLEYDMADVPVLLGGFLFGPVPGLLLTLTASLIQGVTVSAQAGPAGIFMHVLATGAYVLTASLVYRKMHSRQGALAGLFMGTLAMTALMVPLNLLITGWYMGVPLQQLLPLFFPYIIPFNLFKGLVNGAVTFLVYKRIRALFNRLFEAPPKK